MANLKSAKKQAKKSEKNRKRNLTRKTALKTIIKKTLAAIAAQNVEESQEFFKQAQAKLARAKNKGVLHANNAARKVGRLARRLNKMQSATKPA